MAQRKSKTAAPPATTEEAAEAVAAAEAKVDAPTEPEEGSLMAVAEERGYLGTVPAAGIEAQEAADLRNGTAGAPKE